MDSLISRLVDALETDKELRQVYVANIAMAFKDEYARHPKAKQRKAMNRLDVHKIANQAAENFIDLLCK